MNAFYMVIYFTAFALLMGSAFALVYANIRGLQEMDKRPINRHPEAPMPGEEVMYVDVSTDTADEFQERKDKLENLFNK